MLTEERGAQLAPFEKALLDNFDSRVAIVLINGDSNSYCDLTEAFVCDLLAQPEVRNDSEHTILKRIVSCSDFLTTKVVDAIFDTQDEEIIQRYLASSQGHGMESSHIIKLLELGNDELTDLYFRRFFAMVMTDDFYEPVVHYLKQSGQYAKMRAKYMPQRFKHA